MRPTDDDATVPLVRRARRVQLLTIEGGKTTAHAVFEAADTLVSGVLPSFTPTVEGLAFG